MRANPAAADPTQGPTLAWLFISMLAACFIFYGRTFRFLRLVGGGGGRNKILSLRMVHIVHIVHLQAGCFG